MRNVKGIIRPCRNLTSNKRPARKPNTIMDEIAITRFLLIVDRILHVATFALLCRPSLGHF